MLKKIFLIFIIICYQPFVYANYNYSNNLNNNEYIEQCNKNKELKEYARLNYEYFKKYQIIYESTNFESENEKEETFLKLYKKYIDGIDELNEFYYNNDFLINKEYINLNKYLYKQYGASFIYTEGNYYFTYNYNNLINTKNIPQVFKKWLKLQQKYIQLEQKQSEINEGYEGTQFSAKELEQAIIDLEKIENESQIIASINNEEFNYIPITSIWVIENYLLGNEINPRFDYNESELLDNNFKSSYENFLEKNKTSKYYPLIKEYYNKLKNNKFKYSEKNKNWLELEILKYDNLNKKNINNNLQKEFEENNPIQILASILPAKYLINEEFEAMQNDINIKTIYGELNKNKNKQEKIGTPISKINKKYIEQCIKTFENIYNDIPVSKIIVPNEEYSILSNETKYDICLTNIIINSIKIPLSQIKEYPNKIISLFNDKYLNNKNNMKQNYEIITYINESIKNLNKSYEYLINNIDYIKQNVKPTNDNIKKIYLNAINELQTYSDEISNYSYTYEKTKYNNWLTKNNKKKIIGNLDSAIYNYYFQPKNGLYIFNKYNYPLFVVKSVQNGVILCGDFRITNGFNKNILLITSKKYADNQIINEPIIAEYKGIYEYKTKFGITQRINKFYCYGQKEINANFKIPNEKFYFYKPF